MTAADAELISPNAKRYTSVSVGLCAVVSVVIAVIVVLLCKTYLMICFFVGALIALCMYIGRLSPKNRNMFDSFCAAYYRFVPDDELRKTFHPILMYAKAQARKGILVDSPHVSYLAEPKRKKTA